MQKAGGNPFFVIQFLKAVNENGFLVYHQFNNEWTWDAEGIESMVITDNVLDLVSDNMKRLTPTTQKLLVVAACLGSTFTLDALNVAKDGLIEHSFTWNIEPDQGEEVIPETKDELDLCIAQGLLVIRHKESDRNAYSFVHDQIQRAALGLVSEEILSALQLHLGRTLLLEERAVNFEKYFCMALDLYNRGYSRSIVQQDVSLQERARVARSNLLAAQKVCKSK